MAIRNQNIDEKVIRVLVFLWFLSMMAAAIFLLVKSIRLILYSGGFAAGVMGAFFFVCALGCATAGVLPYIHQSVDWFSDWFVTGLLWSHARNKKAGDPIEPICRLIEQRRYLEARVGLERLLERHPEKYEARFVLAELLAVYQQDESTAFALLQEYFSTAKHKPVAENIPALLLFADLAERAGRPGEARRILRQECHARYAPEDRRQLEERLETLIG